MAVPVSPSARREWIEMSGVAVSMPCSFVSLCEEGVD